MSVSSAFKSFIREQMESFGPVTLRSMFGGVGIYYDGLMFALLDDDTLYFKVDATSRPRFEEEGLPIFLYPMKDGRMQALNYFRSPERCLEEPDDMRIWCSLAFAAALRARKKPAKKPNKNQLDI